MGLPEKRKVFIKPISERRRSLRSIHGMSVAEAKKALKQAEVAQEVILEARRRVVDRRHRTIIERTTPEVRRATMNTICDWLIEQGLKVKLAEHEKVAGHPIIGIDISGNEGNMVAWNNLRKMQKDAGLKIDSAFDGVLQAVLAKKFPKDQPVIGSVYGVPGSTSLFIMLRNNPLIEQGESLRKNLNRW